MVFPAEQLSLLKNPITEISCASATPGQCCGAIQNPSRSIPLALMRGIARRHSIGREGKRMQTRRSSFPTTGPLSLRSKCSVTPRQAAGRSLRGAFTILRICACHLTSAARLRSHGYAVRKITGRPAARRRRADQGTPYIPVRRRGECSGGGLREAPVKNEVCGLLCLGCGVNQKLAVAANLAEPAGDIGGLVLNQGS